MSTFHARSFYRTRLVRRFDAETMILRESPLDLPCRARTDHPHGSCDLFPDLRRSERTRSWVMRRSRFDEPYGWTRRLAAVLRKHVA
jgi:hypothetical protein